MSVFGDDKYNVYVTILEPWAIYTKNAVEVVIVVKLNGSNFKYETKETLDEFRLLY